MGKLILSKGATIYRACCTEEVVLEPGRIAEFGVLEYSAERDAVLLERKFPGVPYGRTKPTKHTASWLEVGGFRNTPQEAAESGVTYLRRYIGDHEEYLRVARLALDALAPKARP